MVVTGSIALGSTRMVKSFSRQTGIPDARLLPQKSRDNNVMHAKPDLRVFLKWKIAYPGSVIVTVIPLKGTLCQLIQNTCFHETGASLVGLSC